MLKQIKSLPGIYWLCTLGLLNAALYIYMLRLSYGELSPRSSSNDYAAYITVFLVTYAILFVLYLVLIVPLLKGWRMDPRLLWFAIAFGLLFRVILLPSDLILENDIYRYMWDGHMQVEGINPFRWAPGDPETVPFRTDYWAQINYKQIPTIYPPTLQLVFLISGLIYPGSVMGMKFVLLCFDVAAIFLLLWALPKLNRPPEWCLIYAWSPLVLKEIANSGHADVVSAALMVLLIGLVGAHRWVASTVALALLTLTKFFGVFLLPLFFFRWKWTYYLLFAAIVAVMYMPFLSTEFSVLEGFLTFSEEWVFNAGLFTFVRNSLIQYADVPFHQAGWVARQVLMGVIVLTVLVQAAMLYWRREAEDVLRAVFTVLATLLMCSPVINCWYLVWIVPLLCVFPNRAWLLFSGLCFLSYTYYYTLSFAPWVQPLQFIPFFVLLLWDVFRGTANNRPLLSDATPDDEATEYDEPEAAPDDEAEGKTGLA